MDISLLFKFPGILILIGVVLLIIAIIIGIIAYKTPAEDDEVSVEDNNENRVVFDTNHETMFDEKEPNIKENLTSNQVKKAAIQEEPAPVSGFTIKQQSTFTENISNNNVQSVVENRPNTNVQTPNFTKVQSTTIMPAVNSQETSLDIKPLIEDNKQSFSTSNDNNVINNLSNLSYDVKSEPIINEKNTPIKIEEKKPIEITSTEKVDTNKSIVTEEKKPIEITSDEKIDNNESITIKKDISNVPAEKMIEIDNKKIKDKAKDIKLKTRVDEKTLIEPEIEEPVKEEDKNSSFKDFSDKIVIESQEEPEKIVFDIPSIDQNEEENDKIIFSEDDDDFIEQKNEYLKDFKEHENKPVYGGVKPLDDIKLDFDEGEKPIYKSKFEDTDNIPRIVINQDNDENVELL